jgi:hypothetical protein
MKMRKLLPLVLLAIGAIFLLSSCDALLDAIYPNNSLTIDVAVSTAHVDWAVPGSYAFIDVYDSAGNLATLSAPFSSYDLNYAYTSVNFPKLKNDTYTVYAFYHSVYSGYNYGASVYSPSQVVSFGSSLGSATVSAIIY